MDAELPWSVHEDGGVVLIRTATGREIRASSDRGAPLDVFRAVAEVLAAWTVASSVPQEPPADPTPRRKRSA